MNEIEGESRPKRFQFSITDMVVVSAMSFAGLILLDPVTTTCIGNASAAVRFGAMLGIIASTIVGAYFGLPREKNPLPNHLYMLGGIIFGWIVFVMLLFAVGPIFFG